MNRRHAYRPPEPPQPKYDDRPVYRSFDAYVQDHPEGEDFRNWLTLNRFGKPNNRTLYILPAFDIMHGGMPGGYVWAYVYQWHYNKQNVPCSPQDSVRIVCGVQINDNDDGSWNKSSCDSLEAAQAEVEQLTQLAPFSMSDLCETFGYAPI